MTTDFILLLGSSTKGSSAVERDTTPEEKARGVDLRWLAEHD
jgi:hypothetical protein